MWRVKSLDAILATAEKKSLHRSLGAFQLTMLGIGGIIGTGIFVLTAEAAQKAGPGMMLAFVIAGFVCAVAALCYAELASMVPVAGSAYTYSYAVLGEFVAWLVGWALILEYAVAASAVAVGWSGYIVGLIEHSLHVTLPVALTSGPYIAGGIVNLPADKGGKDVEITLLVNGDYGTDRNLAEGIVGQMEKLGLRVVLNTLDGTKRDAANYSGRFDWLIRRHDSEITSTVQNTAALATTGPQTSWFHRAGKDGEVDRLPYEQEMVDIVNKFIKSGDAAERAELMKQYQKVSTENVNGVGLTEYPGALIINKRFANIPEGAPIFMFNWAEDNIIRERVFVPADKQSDFELHEETVVAQPGDKGPLQ